MCELCHETPCLPGCPNAPVDKSRLICAWCDEPIFDDQYFSIDGEPVCSDCVEECRRFGTEREAI